MFDIEKFVSAFTTFAVCLCLSLHAVAGDLAPGDFGYRHDDHHPSYQKVFGGKCACGAGDCRVTTWRKTKLSSPKGYDIFVDGNWYALPGTAYVPDSDTIPLDLQQDRAHVCAYGGDRKLGQPPTIPCAIINDPTM